LYSPFLDYLYLSLEFFFLADMFSHYSLSVSVSGRFSSNTLYNFAVVTECLFANTYAKEIQTSSPPYPVKTTNIFGINTKSIKNMEGMNYKIYQHGNAGVIKEMCREYCPQKINYKITSY